MKVLATMRTVRNLADVSRPVRNFPGLTNRPIFGKGLLIDIVELLSAPDPLLGYWPEGQRIKHCALLPWSNAVFGFRTLLAIGRRFSTRDRHFDGKGIRISHGT